MSKDWHGNIWDATEIFGNCRAYLVPKGVEKQHLVLNYALLKQQLDKCGSWPARYSAPIISRLSPDERIYFRNVAQERRKKAPDQPCRTPIIREIRAHGPDFPDFPNVVIRRDSGVVQAMPPATSPAASRA